MFVVGSLGRCYDFCDAVSWATIAVVCYSNSLLQIHNRFSLETSRGLRAALSETGLEQDSASLTETEREKSNFATEDSRGQDMQRFKTERRRKRMTVNQWGTYRGQTTVTIKTK